MSRRKRLTSKEARRKHRAEERGRNFHPQLRIEHDGVSAYVDEAMAPLILGLWRQGFDTGASCKAFPPLHDLTGASYAYVAFRNADDADRFGAIVDGVTDDDTRLVIGAPDFEPSPEQAHDALWFVGFPTTDLGAVEDALELSRNLLRTGERPS